MWRYLAAYVHCSVPKSMRVYRFSLTLPTFTTGLLPIAFGILCYDFNMVLAGAVLVGGAAGDFSMLMAGVAFHSQVQVMDHPSEPAFIILNKGNVPTAA